MSLTTTTLLMLLRSRCLIPLPHILLLSWNLAIQFFWEKTESSFGYRRILFFFWRYLLWSYITQCQAILYVVVHRINEELERERERELEWWILRVCNWHRQRSLKQKSLFLYVHIERREPLFLSSSSALYITNISSFSWFLSSVVGSPPYSMMERVGLVSSSYLYSFPGSMRLFLFFFFRGVEDFVLIRIRRRSHWQ